MRKIFIIGSINLDNNIYIRKMPKIGETIQGVKYTQTLGGKGINQAIAAQKISKNEIRFLGKVGMDDNGKKVIEFIKEYGISLGNLGTTKSEPTGTTFINVSKEEANNNIVIFKGANDCLTKEEVESFLKEAKDNDIFLTQLENNINLVKYALEIANSKNMYTVLNPSPLDSNACSLLKHVDLLVTNETETCDITRLEVNTESDFQNIYKQLKNLGIKDLLVTLGKDGSVFVNEEKTIKTPSIKADVKDVTGAGDCYLGTYLAYLAEGHTIEESMMFASCCASLAIAKEGTASSMPSRNEAQELFQNIRSK